MQKKAVIFIVNIFIIFVISSMFSEIINFVYITPYILPFLFFVSVLSYGFFDDKYGMHLAFLYGFLSDIVMMNKIFVFSALFPSAIFIIGYLSKKYRIPKGIIFTAFILIYITYISLLQMIPFALILFLFIFIYLFYLLLNLIFKLFMHKKEYV